MRRSLLLVVVACLALLTVWGTVETGGSVLEAKPQVGHPAPPFSLKGLDGQTYRVDGAREKPLVINFWASWCGPCRMEAPDLKKVFEKYRGSIDLYAVNVTKDDNLESAKQFVQSFQLPFPILLDEQGSVADRYRVHGIPTTFFVDRHGVIRHIVLGMVDAASLEKQIKALLSN